jgi:uncharacterized protein with PIN domain
MTFSATTRMATVIDLAVDTSALTAILLGEPEASDLLKTLVASTQPSICAPNRTEFLIVMQARLGDVGVERGPDLSADAANPDDRPQ